MYGRCGSWWRGGIATPFMGGGFPWGRGGRWGRFFGPGEIRLALLSMLEGGPKHGYELMKELETKSGGIYKASAGAIYPALQQLEDEGMVTSDTAAGKRTSDNGGLQPNHREPVSAARHSSEGGFGQAGSRSVGHEIGRAHV